MHEYAAALMAGGRSRRMGADKAFLSWQGRPLWEHQLAKLRSLEPGRLLLSCRSDQPFPPLPDVLPVHDQWPDCGPLGGVASCLQASDAPLLVVLGIDLPFLPAGFLCDLLTHCTAQCGAVVSLGNYFEPLAAVYSRAMLSLAEAQIAEGHLAMQDFLRLGIERGLMRRVNCSPDPQWFTNMNTPEDLMPRD